MAQARQETLQDVWDKYCDSSSWNFVTIGLKNGDLYFVLGLMRAFRRLHGNGAAIRFLADTDGKSRLLKLFPNVVDCASFVPELAGIRPNDIDEWSKLTNRDHFGPGSLIRLHPYTYSSSQYRVQSCLGNPSMLHLVDLFKTMMRIPLSYSPGWPSTPNLFESLAHSLFEEFGLPVGRTLIIFPYAQTLAFDAMPVLVEVAKLARESGLTVCSAVHGAEAPVKDTIPITVTFDMILPLCELAGAVVALRSGIGDMLSCVSVNRVNLYSNGALIFHESTNSYGMCDCSENISISQNDENISAARNIISRLQREPFTDPDQYTPPALIKYFNLQIESCDNIAFSSDNSCELGRYTLFPGAVLAEGWSGAERWGVWSVGFRSVCYFLAPKSKDILELDLVFAVDTANPTMVVTIRLNETVQQISVSCDNRKRSIQLPLSQKQKEVSVHRLIVEIEEPMSPREASGGAVGDGRLIGIGLSRARYVTTQPS